MCGKLCSHRSGLKLPYRVVDHLRLGIFTEHCIVDVCCLLFAFLVFINSSISFVVTDLIGLHDGEGDAVGTLGFADELLALAACPLWGVISDQIGVRHVSYCEATFAL